MFAFYGIMAGKREENWKNALFYRFPSKALTEGGRGCCSPSSVILLSW
jgi:hypothetical protein